MTSLHRTEISGIRLQNPLMNGAYIHSKTLVDIRQLVGSSSGAVVVGSISIKPRNINTVHGYWTHRERFFSLNSYGMPNGGMPYFEKFLPKMVQLAHAAQKPLIANVVGFSNKEFVDLIKFCEKAKVDMVELNLGCPNVWNDGKQKRILSYHPEEIDTLLKSIVRCSPQIPVCLKLSPLSPDILFEVAQIVRTSGIISVITATNSYPNASLTTGSKAGASTDDILAGLTGRALKPISLGVVKQLQSLLPQSIDIIGCGGISTNNDVQDYLAAGAKAVQVATALYEDGMSIFDKILYQAKH